MLFSSHRLPPLKYHSFWNDVWLIFNDVIIGSAVGSFLCENSNYLGSVLQGRLEVPYPFFLPNGSANASHTQHWLVEFPLLALVWLNSWPAGLKLNTELSQFYCHTLLGIVVVWGGMSSRLVLHHAC